MKGFKDLFGNLFTGGKGAGASRPSLGSAGPAEPPTPVSPAPGAPAGHERLAPEAAYKTGDLDGTSVF